MATSGLMAAFSTAFSRMVVEVVGDQGGVVGVVAGVGVVVRVVARSATLLATSSTMCISPAVILMAGLAVVSVGTPVILWAGLTDAAALCTPTGSTGAEMVEAVVVDQAGNTVVVTGVLMMAEAVVLMARATTLSTTSRARELSPASSLASSKIDDGRNPPSSISGSHLILIGAITNNLENMVYRARTRI